MSSRPTPHASRDKGLSNTSTHPNIQYHGLPSVATLASRRIQAKESKHPAFQLHTTCPDLPNVPVSLSGSTVFEDELNAIMAESWSAPTYSYSGTIEDLMAGLDDTRQEKSNPDRQRLRMSDISHIDRKSHVDNAGSRLQEFFNDTAGSAPWAPNNLRVWMRLVDPTHMKAADIRYSNLELYVPSAARSLLESIVLGTL